MPTKETTVVAFRLRNEIVAAVDRAAQKKGVTRTEMVAALLAKTYTPSNEEVQ
jgi:hypothetical protein